MKKVLILLIIFVMSVSFCGCTSNSYETTDSGYMLTPGIPCEVEGYLTYEIVLYEGELTKVVDQAESLVKKWWNDDSTFSRPNIAWYNILSGDVRGFQADDYIFLEVNASEDDLLATTVHEWLHYLVDKYTLISTDGYGRPLMEMVAEAITVDILNGVVEVAPTENFLYFKENDELWEKKDELVRAFRNSEGFTAYERIFGQNEATKILEEVTIVFS